MSDDYFDDPESTVATRPLTEAERALQAVAMKRWRALPEAERRAQIKDIINSLEGDGFFLGRNAERAGGLE